MLASIDIAGLVIGLYAALALRSVDRRPEADPLGAALGSRERLARLPDPAARPRLLAGRASTRHARRGRVQRAIVPSVFLVAALALAFAIGTGQHFTTFGLYVVGAVFVAILIPSSVAATRLVTGILLRAAGRSPQGDARRRRRAARTAPRDARREPGRHRVRLRRRGRPRRRTSSRRSPRVGSTR